jgi:aryl-alcohol dehydrogenase-like predicted oxidoreductase
MKYNILGNTGLLVSGFCLGTMTFGGKGRYAPIGNLDQEAANKLVAKAVESGINFIDTANIYSDGLSEQITGQAIRELRLNRAELVIATKVRGKMGNGPNQVGLTRKHILEQADASLKRMGLDYIDLYQIHGYDPLTPLEETLKALDTLVQTGKVRYIGCSNLTAWQLMKALGISEYRNLSRFISLQAYYTVAGRELERELIPLLNDQQVGLMVWSPLAGGFLSGKFKRNTRNPEDSRRSSFDFPLVDKEKAYDIIEVLEPMATGRNVSVARLALAWLLHQPIVSSLIIGAKKIEQLEDNLRSAEIKFTKEEMDRLDVVSKLSPEYPGWIQDYMAADRKQ